MLSEMIIAELQKIGGDRVRLDEPLSTHTSMRVGGPASAFIEVESEGVLRELILLCRGNAIPFLIMGGGTNLIVRDGGWRGVVVKLVGKQLEQIEVEGERVVGGGGARLPALVEESVRHSLSGLETLAGIPGTVGGAVRMNAGAYGASFGDCIGEVCVMAPDGSIRADAGGSMGFSYRECRSLGERIVLGVTMGLRRGEKIIIEQKYAQCLRERASWLPRVPSAGCVFRNPPSGLTAGELIDQLGLKGTRCGAAAVYDRHANIIVNEGGASSRDVLELMSRVRERVREARGITLEPELVIVGEDA